MADYPFDNNSSQAERRRILAEERRGRTFQGRALADLDDAGGRYATENKQSVTASTPSSAYPKILDGPWAKDELPPEPLIDGRGESKVLGYCIDKPDAPSPAAASAVEDVGGGGLSVGPATQPFKRRI